MLSVRQGLMHGCHEYIIKIAREKGLKKKPIFAKIEKFTMYYGNYSLKIMNV